MLTELEAGEQGVVPASKLTEKEEKVLRREEKLEEMRKRKKAAYGGHGRGKGGYNYRNRM